MSESGRICVNNGGPPMNMDVSGIGVRVSFYLQTLFLAYLSARSNSPDETASSLYTLIVTNSAMIVAALTLGLRSAPEVTFQDSLVVFYLLCLSWICVYFSMPFGKGFKALKGCFVLQSYLFFAFAFTLLAKGKSFGSRPECNPNAVVVLFRPFPALTSGRIVGWILVTSLFLVYTFITVKDVVLRQKRPLSIVLKVFRLQSRPKSTSTEAVRPLSEKIENTNDTDPNILEQGAPPLGTVYSQKYSMPIDWKLLLKMILITILWALGVMNTELLIVWSRFERVEEARSPWQFGQLLPVFLVIIPLVNMVSCFYRKNGLRPVG
ncbi:hypothetical protein CPB86DRAFT_786453 [Serendipita vermifera]|nr:hypothetical protein CPB86DRAFT_786453 [Serendipita vermifera]